MRRCGRFLPGLFWDFCDLALPNGCGTSGQARPVASGYTRLKGFAHHAAVLAQSPGIASVFSIYLEGKDMATTAEVARNVSQRVHNAGF